MELQEYLKHIVELCAYYPITFSGDKPNCLNRWLIKGDIVSGYDETGLMPHLKTEGDILSLEQQAVLSKEEREANWRYYITHDLRTDYIDLARNYAYTAFSEDTETYIYSLCSIYCENEMDVFFHIDTITPIKVWIEGQIVFKSSYKHHVKTHYFTMRLKKGINIVLVEKPSFAEHRKFGIPTQFFTILLKPCGLVFNERNNGFIDTNLFEDLKKRYLIIPSKAFFDTEDEINFTVLPECFNNEKEEVKYQLINTSGKLVHKGTAETSREISINLEESGIFELQVESITSAEKKSNVYIYKGDFIRERDNLLEKAEGKGIREDIISSITSMTNAPDINTGCYRGFTEPINDTVYYMILQKYYEFEKYVSNSEIPQEADILNVFSTSAMILDRSEVDGGGLAYTVFYPDNYHPGKKYPLVVYMQYGYASSSYPILPKFILKRQFENAIILNVSGRGDLSRDYINEAEILKILSETQKRLNIDRDRIYLVGVCTGSLRAFSMAIRKPDLFSGMIFMTGTMWLNTKDPDYEYLENLNNTPLLELCNLDDIAFNGAKVINVAKHIKGAEVKTFFDLGHIEFEEILNNTLLIDRLIEMKKERYPKEISHTILEPIYNKSHWVKAEYIDDLQQRAVLKAQILNNFMINIECSNIKRLSLMLDTKAMGLEKQMGIKVNGLEKPLCLSEYSKVVVTLRAGKLDAEVIALHKADFDREYDFIGIDENVLGIKQLYYKKCKIIRPQQLNNSSNVNIKKLFYLLLSPHKERVRQYKYEILEDSSINLEDLSQSNFIYVMDARNINEQQKGILSQADIEADSEKLFWQNRTYSGKFFAMLKTANPFETSKQALILVYNDDALLNELIKILNVFHTNNIFYADALIYNNEAYSLYRRLDNEILEQ